MNYWIITVKNPYCDYILRGLKTMELRKAVPAALQPGDVIFIVRKGDRGRIVGACSVTSVLTESVSYFCNHYYCAHRVKGEEIKEYAGDRRRLFGIGLERMKLYSCCLNVHSFGYTRAPQCFYRIKFKSSIEISLNAKTEGGEK